ncbi:MAG: hypothetical protein OXD48_11235 [Litoreibacter sp.]|nr:hypothetical protein [Litoreibacter sp.]
MAPVETIAMIREPVSWLGSWYRYRRRSALAGHKNSTENKSFDDFVEAYVSETPPDFANIGAQSRFLCNDAGELAVDHLFVYEDFGPFISFLSDRLKREIVLDHVNASPKMDVALSTDLKNAVKERFARDFELHAEAAKSF